MGHCTVGREMKRMECKMRGTVPRIRVVNITQSLHQPQPRHDVQSLLTGRLRLAGGMDREEEDAHRPPCRMVRGVVTPGGMDDDA